MPKQEDYDITIAIVVATGMFLLLGAFMLLFFFLNKNRQKKNKKEKLYLQSQFSQTLLQTKLEIQEQTLQTISEEIHDNIGQVLSLVKLNLNTFPDNLEEAIKLKIEDTEQLLSKAIADLRDISQSMNTDKIASLGLEAAIALQLQQIQKTGRFGTQFHTSGIRRHVEPQKEMVLFRIVQEALNNAVKHSGAKNITINILYTPESLLLQVSDDGIGFTQENAAQPTAGIGLKNIQNRVALIGAVFSIHSTIDNGTTLTIELKTPA